MRNGKGLDSVQALLSSNKKIHELSTLFPAQMQTVNPYQLLQRKLTLSQPNPVLNGSPITYIIENKIYIKDRITAEGETQN